MVLKCEIKFDDNPYGIYFSGQTLTGKVEVTTDKIKKVRGICLKICGFAQCHWTERKSRGSGKHRRTHTVSYDGRDDYLSSTTYLIGSEHGNSLDIPIGVHTYSFACALPHMIPTSFEGSYGHIRYTVRVALERPWKFDQTYKIAFTVLKQLDLNYDSPGLRIGSQIEQSETFCCWPCESGPLMISASIPQSGYVPGQEILAMVNLSNSSNVDVYEISYSLKKVIYYHSQTPHAKSKLEIMDILELKSAGAPAGSNGKFEKKLVVPAVPPTNITSCRVIHIMYEIHFEIKVTGAHSNPVLKIPITIGTIPLNMALQHPGNPPIQMGGFQQPQPTLAPYPITQQPYPGSSSTAVPGIGFSSPTVPNVGPAPGPSTSSAGTNQPFLNAPSAPQNLSDLPPPSYEECFGGQKEITDDDDKNAISQTAFSPRYPVYNFNNATAPQ